uniref:RING-type E3 ubiquitin transferase n=1 Tax=Leptobrachium leishanense TaxID=445787 RepID=A0A8C5M554_9ANUR
HGVRKDTLWSQQNPQSRPPENQPVNRSQTTPPDGQLFRDPRAFGKGVCRWGQNCRFSHERKATQICRHFQNGFCGYGEKCSYLHIVATGAPPDAPCHYAGRRVSEPCILPRSCDLSVRRGSEPAVNHLQAVGTSLGRSSPTLHRPDWALAPEFVPRHAGSDLVRSVSSPILQQEIKDVKPLADATGKSSKHLHSDTDVSDLQYQQSRNVVCGICMDKVYDKPVTEDRVFGILPNCSHSYCVDCIKRWRKTRDFQNEVTKSCPQCRIKSTYYIPHKYWISDSEEKQKLVEYFKAKTSKIRCRFFAHGNGYCPFKSECIYLHERTSGHQRRRRDHRRPSASLVTETAFKMTSLPWLPLQILYSSVVLIIYGL